MKTKLHVFNDPHGFMLNATVERFKRENRMEANRFVNLTHKTIYPHNDVVYLEKSITSYKTFIHSMPEIASVAFYPFDETAAWFLHELHKKQPALPASWIFWSYEFYHQPETYTDLLEPFSLQFYKKNQQTLNGLRNQASKLAKKILRIPYRNHLLKQGYQYIKDFYSFLPEDYKNVSAVFDQKPAYHPISFLSLDEMTSSLSPGHLTNTVIIGHSASVTGNHAEILEKLKKIDPDNNLLIPMEYGEAAYREEILRLAGNFFPGKVNFITNRLTLTEYNQQLSIAGYAIFNFVKQEGLGNIVFLLWNGTKVFLREESSAFKQFRNWGLKVYSVNKDLNKEALSTLLDPRDAVSNRKILESLFSEERVREYWQPLMQSPL
jgi:dTDP-N-acetylfucosamine:lipid II N-acetylfucosaminyltransferase